MLNNIIVFENYKSQNDNENVNRLKSHEVSYMELKDINFRCDEFSYYIKGYCKNKKVKSKVSDCGCCNLYEPKNEDQIDSKYWKIK